MADAKKAELMRKKTDEFRKEFNISKPDCVIQWYDCGLSTFNSGKLFVSQNFVCYKGSTSERMPYNKITEVLFEEGLSSKVTIKLDKKVLTFGSFGLKRGQARECFEFINYLRNNSVSYIDPEVIDAHIKQVQAAQAARGEQQTQMNRAKVDTEASDALLRSAIEADFLQNQAAETLQRQNEQINRIGSKIDGIENSLDRSEHLLRGIESARYYMFGSQKNKNAPAREQALKTRTASAAPGAPPPIELDILYKNKDDSVLQSILILDTNSFSCIHPATGKLIDKGTQWKYDQIESIVMRARHEHMDVRFKGTAPVKERRVRLMCSYLQVLTNQLWSRSGKKVPVAFEQYVRKFDYKDDRVLVVPPSSREGGAITPGANQGGFNRPAPKTSTLLADSSVETRQDMDYVDNNLDQVLVLAKGMNQRGNEMVRQIDNSNQVLNSYNNRMDNINSRVQNQNARLDHQIDKY